SVACRRARGSSDLDGIVATIRCPARSARSLARWGTNHDAVAAAVPAARAGSQGPAERDHEGKTVGQADVREVQDYPPPQSGTRHLPEQASQAATGLARRWHVSPGSTSP